MQCMIFFKCVTLLVLQVHNVVATYCPNLTTLTFSGDYKVGTLNLVLSDLGISSPLH